MASESDVPANGFLPLAVRCDHWERETSPAADQWA
jgi:hypothetical protein